MCMTMCRNAQQSRKELQSERNTAWFEKVSQMNKSNAESRAAQWVEMTCTRMNEAVSLKVVSLEKSHVTHGASIWFDP